MSYFPVDDGFTFHPKALAAGNEALGMWVRAGAWCKAHVTGGNVPRDIARAIGSRRTADRLVAAGLWVETPEGYAFHDWQDQAGNDDAETEKARRDRQRARNAERQARHRARNSESNAVTNGPVTPSPSPSPSPSPRPTDVTDTLHQSPPTRGRAWTDAEVSAMTAKLAGQRGITSLGAVADCIAEHTGREVDPVQTFQVAIWILDKARTTPRAPQRYVTGSISRSWAEVQQHIDGEVA